MTARALATHGRSIWISWVNMELIRVNMAKLKFEMVIMSVNAKKMKFDLGPRIVVMEGYVQIKVHCEQINDN